jgi:hypothetical protein
MSEFHDHSTKQTIREQWCKPLLEHINKTLGYKLIYLGLPGIKILDILSWQQYLDKVIAFDCGDYNNPPDPVVSKKNMDELNENLRKLEREKIISTYSIYQGYMEQVVLKGLDDKGNKFSQADFITVYNLDFCNPLTVPHIIIDEKGNSSSHYKTEVITKLLEQERDLSNNDNKKFIMFLTVHSQFWENEAEKLFKREKSSSYAQYMKDVSKLTEDEKNVRLLKLYAFHVLKNHFCERQFIPDFLTPIYYEGTGKKWLVCFTIIGTYHKTSSGCAFFNQNINKLLKTKFLIANSTNIKQLKISQLDEDDTEINPVKLFTQSATYKYHWTKK